MMPKQKSNGNGAAGEAETILAEHSGLAVGDDALAYLDRALNTPARERVTDPVRLIDPSTFRAAIEQLRSGDELLLVGEPRRGGPAWTWRGLARFTPTKIGSHDFISARAWTMPLTARQDRALARIFGDNHDADDDGLSVAPVELEAVAELTLPSGSTIIYCRFRRIWLSVGAIRTRLVYAPKPSPQPAQYRPI